jgi:hypothetical protein
MKIKKTVLQAVVAAVVVTTVTACAVSDVSPEGEKVTKNKTIDSCPACGMG